MSTIITISRDDQSQSKKFLDDLDNNKLSSRMKRSCRHYEDVHWNNECLIVIKKIMIIDVEMKENRWWSIWNSQIERKEYENARNILNLQHWWRSKRSSLESLNDDHDASKNLIMIINNQHNQYAILNHDTLIIYFLETTIIEIHIFTFI